MKLKLFTFGASALLGGHIAVKQFGFDFFESVLWENPKLIFHSNVSDPDPFLKTNLATYRAALMPSKDLRVDYSVYPRAQGHTWICHGGFTAMIVENSARKLLKAQGLSDVFFSDFKIQYKSPIPVLQTHSIDLHYDAEKSLVTYRIVNLKDQVTAVGELKVGQTALKK